MSEVLTPEQIAALGVPGSAPAQVMTTTQAGEQVGAGASAPAPTLAPTEALKTPVTSKEVTLPDGRVVVLQKPLRSVNLFIAKVLGMDSGNPMLSVYFKTVAYVRGIDGQAVPPLRNRIDFEALCEVLGDDALDELALEVNDLSSGATLDKAEVKKS